MSLLRVQVICLLEFATFTAMGQTPAQQIGAVLDDWHQAASVADEARYFGHFAPNGVFMGTDATERWTAAQYNFSVPIPNARVDGIVKQIGAK